jgi:hypothetical protein
MKGVTCCVCGSENKVQEYKNTNKYYCLKHRNHLDRYGYIKKRTMKDLNEIALYDNYAEIILYNKECEEIARAIIDLEDVDLVKNHKWCADFHSNTIYCRATINKKRCYLHRFIIDCDDKLNQVIDHKDNNGLNNRKSNLRICTQQENTRNCKKSKSNKSGIIGVYWNKSSNKWVSEITISYKNIRLGYFENFDDAVQARKEAEEKYFGEFAPSLRSN